MTTTDIRCSTCRYFHGRYDGDLGYCVLRHGPYAGAIPPDPKKDPVTCIDWFCSSWRAILDTDKESTS
jgi:hypothetical protein